MIIYPAIDLKGGRCVRLVQGDMAQSTCYGQLPKDQALAFVKAGAEWLHLVDLDGAMVGDGQNSQAISALIEAVPVPVQLGGGIRTMRAIEAWLDRGVARVILGTSAVRDPDLVLRAAGRFHEQIAVGIDARDGLVAVEGWAVTSGLGAGEVALRCADYGVSTIIHTDIGRDGMLEGVNWQASERLAEALAAHHKGVQVIASGGVGSMADLESLMQARGLSGVVIGRALYEGRIALAKALDYVQGQGS